MAETTAMQDLFAKYRQIISGGIPSDSIHTVFFSIFEQEAPQLLEKERKLLIAAYNEGEDNWTKEEDDARPLYANGEHYFNSNYHPTNK